MRREFIPTRYEEHGNCYSVGAFLRQQLVAVKSVFRVSGYAGYVDKRTVSFILFIPCIVNDLHILTVPANAQFYYVFHSQSAATPFGLAAIIRELTPTLLKLTAIRYSTNA